MEKFELARLTKACPPAASSYLVLDLYCALCCYDPHCVYKLGFMISNITVYRGYYRSLVPCYCSLSNWVLRLTREYYNSLYTLWVTSVRLWQLALAWIRDDILAVYNLLETPWHASFMTSGRGWEPTAADIVSFVIPYVKVHMVSWLIEVNDPGSTLRMGKWCAGTADYRYLVYYD